MKPGDIASYQLVHSDSLRNSRGHTVVTNSDTERRPMVSAPPLLLFVWSLGDVVFAVPSVPVCAVVRSKITCVDKELRCPGTSQSSVTGSCYLLFLSHAITTGLR
ncbi:hypothetical protein KIN20_036651 [Parelaphostrongylus tenuis]|uniref:Uncharacterized protein n=1 Tax=Parelaphostrongylus tenuis TaxID=148309 RepID=A0AAD5RDF8_PARTN|nr:hypothetical protein KIN20_036651 [Parelaphostrongylus tenuis]